MTTSLLVPLHMGALHPVETIAIVAVAFGPLLVIALIMWRRSHTTKGQDPAEPQEPEQAAAPH